MNDICTCDGSWENFGSKGCLGEAGEVTAITIAPYFDANNDKVCIPGGQALDKAYLESKYNAENIKNRWLLQKGTKKLAPISEDDILDSSDVRTDIKLSDGKRGLQFSIVTNEPHKLKRKYDILSCQESGVFLNTDKNNIVGICSGSDLCMRRVTYFSAQVIEKSTQNGQANELLVTIHYDYTDTDAKVDYMSLASGTSVSDIEALIDVFAQNLVATTTTLEFELVTANGPKNDRIPAEGTEGDIEIYNQTDSGVITLAGPITYNSTTKKYLATFAAPETSTDVIFVRGIGGTTVASGYDYKATPNETVAIP